MVANTDNRLELGTGRSTGYAEYGDPRGRPVVHLHGCPSSRLELNNPDLIAIAERRGVRLLVPDRPGVGLSDYAPYSVRDYPAMVAAFADAIGLDRFAVMGLSSGGKYVAACAWGIPERISAAVILSGTAPLEAPGVRLALSSKDRQLYGVADRAPWMLRAMLWKMARDVRKDPAVVLTLFEDVSQADRDALARPKVRQTFEATVVEAFRQGSRAAAWDLTLEARPWGFPVEEIAMPVDIWHGEEDLLAVPAHGRALADAIPNARVHFVPGEGHTLAFNRFDEILSSLPD